LRYQADNAALNPIDDRESDFRARDGNGKRSLLLALDDATKDRMANCNHLDSKKNRWLVIFAIYRTSTNIAI
jgi:hypothetical protein